MAESALAELAVEFDRRDVDSDPELLRLYDWRVPVLLRGEQLLLEGRFGADAIRKRVASALPRE